MNEEIESEDY